MAATRRSLDALADIYLITPDNWKHGSGFVSGNKVVRLLAADAYIFWVYRITDKIVSLQTHLHVLS